MDEKHFGQELGNSRNFSPENLAEMAFSLLPPRDYIQTFLLSLFSLLACVSAFATSFGPIPLTVQMRQAAYIYQGKILGRRTEIEKESQRPYTYWNLEQVQVLKSPPNDASTNVILREPGGEVGNIGYRVAGSAEFRDGEEVIVFAHETNEANVKEVFGLASGKYTVESPGATTNEAKKTLTSGIGFVALDSEGEKLSVEEFKHILERVKQNSPTAMDQKIVFNTHGEANHQHENTFPSPLREKKEYTIDKQSSTVNQSTSHNPNSPQNIVQNSPDDPDRNLSGKQEERSTIFTILAVALAVFVAGILWIKYKR